MSQAIYKTQLSKSKDSSDISYIGVVNLHEIPNQVQQVNEKLIIRCKNCPKFLQKDSCCRQDLDKKIWTCETCQHDNDISDFNIELENIPQEYKIELEEQKGPEEDKDYHLIFVIDTSGSMSQHIQELKQQLKSVINNLMISNPSYKVGLIIFESDI